MHIWHKKWNLVTCSVLLYKSFDANLLDPSDPLELLWCKYCTDAQITSLVVMLDTDPLDDPPETLVLYKEDDTCPMPYSQIP